MLSIFEREITWKLYALKRLAGSLTRGSGFTKTESSGTDLTGKWDQTIINSSDVYAHQEASGILAFQTTESKGNFVHDIDGNILLDLCGTERHPLGHFPDAFLKLVSKKNWDQYVINSSIDLS